MAKSKREKTGSIFYDSRDKRWKCAYYTYNQDTSKEIRKTKSFLSETEAKDFLTSIEYQKGNELFIKNNGIPLGKFMREILNKKFDLGIIGESSYVRSLETIRKIEKASIAEENISDITSKEIQEYLNSLRNYSQSYISKIKEKFAQAFREASNEGYIVKNPMNKVILPRSSKETKIVRALELKEQQALTDYLMSVNTIVEPYKTAYLMQMYLGLRIGEALAVKSTDIDLQNNLLKVRRTLTKDKQGRSKIGNTTKTYAGKRDIPIPIQIRDEIVEQMRIAEEHKDHFLFVDSKGNRAVPASVNRRLKEILETMGITDITSHSLRHTYRHTLY